MACYPEDAPSQRQTITALMLSRTSGVLLHPTSLPGGRLGAEAFRFVDWLAAAGQSWWQILPLGPPDEEGSPYRAASAFACWEGLLADPEAPVSPHEIDDFVARHPFWAGEWAAFAGDGALAGQVRFEREWTELREHAAARGVRLIGDLPIYVAPGSADHVMHPELFQDDAVAGVPPDEWSATGQLWGNPLYDWRLLRETGYRWWVERFRRTFELVDAARIDHFRGFVAYWAVPAGNKTALAGRWRRGPGRALFDVVRGELGELSLIAEDLGVITRAVHRLRDELGLPGMAVLHFLLGGRTDPLAVPELRVAYTGTHDNDTSRGWWAGQDERVRARARRAAAAAGVADDDPAWLLIGLALATPARVAIVPAQDLLSLGSEARMNTPGRAEGNWRWRLEPGQLDDALAERLAELTRRTSRQPPRRTGARSARAGDRSSRTRRRGSSP
jgi:4-alpha-glucanotransferase